MKLTQILITAINAVLPIVLLILLGYLLKQKGFLPRDFVKTGNKLVFNICLPCMLFVNVYEIRSFSAIQWDIVIFSVLMLCILFVLGLGTAVAATDHIRRKGVILQCVFRSNYAIIGLSLASALGGEEAIAVAAVMSAFCVPVINILAVVALTIFMRDQQSGKGGIRSVLLGVARNPLILAVTVGLVCVLIRSLQEELFSQVLFSFQVHTKFLYTAVKNLASIASPFALIVLGAQFEFSAVKGMWKEIAVGLVWRIILAPVLAIGCAILLSKFTGVLQCGVNEFPALVALFGSPVAVSSAIMAGSMGNDEQLATQLVVWTSLGSIVTIFVLVCGLMAMGLLAV